MDSLLAEKGWPPSELLVLASRDATSPEQAFRRSHYAHVTLAFAAMNDQPLAALRVAIADVMEECGVRALLPESILFILDLLERPQAMITAGMRAKTFPAVLGAPDKTARVAAGALDEAVRVIDEHQRAVPGGPIRGLMATVTLAAAARIAGVFELGANTSAHHMLELAEVHMRRRERWPGISAHPFIASWPIDTADALVDALQLLNPLVRARLTAGCGA